MTCRIRTPRAAQFVGAGRRGPEGGDRALAGSAPTREAADQVRATIEAQLGELHDLVGYDFIAVAAGPATVAAVGAAATAPACLNPAPQLPNQPSLFDFDGSLFDLSSAPIRLAGEQIGALRVGSEFDLKPYEFSEHPLLHDDHGPAPLRCHRRAGHRSKHASPTAAR